MSLQILEKLSWVAGIISAVVAVIIWLQSFDIKNNISENKTSEESEKIKNFKDNKLVTKLSMKFIPKGSFNMGCPKERCTNNRIVSTPRHFVNIPSFLISSSEISNKQFVEFLNDINEVGSSKEPWLEKAYDTKIEGTIGNFKIAEVHQSKAAIGVTWYGAKAYISWLNKKTGRNFRLPSESEWEHIVRLDILKEIPHGEHIYWVQDCYHSNYHNAPIDGTSWDYNCEIMRNSKNDRKLEIRIIREYSPTYPYERGDLNASSSGVGFFVAHDM